MSRKNHKVGVEEAMTPQPEEWEKEAEEIIRDGEGSLAKSYPSFLMLRKRIILALRQTAERAAERERERCAKVAKEHGEKWKSWQSIPSAISSGQGEGRR